MYFFHVSFSLTSAKAFYNCVHRACMVKYNLWSMAVQRNDETLNLGLVWSCLFQLQVADSGLERSNTRTLQHRPMSWVLSLPLHSKCVHWHILQTCRKAVYSWTAYLHICLLRVCISAYFECAWKGSLACTFDDCGLFIYHYLHETHGLCKPPKAAFLCSLSFYDACNNFLQSTITVETSPRRQKTKTKYLSLKKSKPVSLAFRKAAYLLAWIRTESGFPLKAVLVTEHCWRQREHSKKRLSMSPTPLAEEFSGC